MSGTNRRLFQNWSVPDPEDDKETVEVQNIAMLMERMEKKQAPASSEKEEDSAGA